MNLHHLRVFLAVAKQEHITRAAEEVFLSQPAVSKIIQYLEQDTRQKLVERRGRRIALTHAGRVLQAYARRMFSLEREMEDALMALVDIETGEVTLAASPTIGIYFIPTIIARFRARYSCVKINLKIQSSSALLEDLLEWQLDFGLMELDPTTLPQGLEYETVASDELILVVSPQHPWSKLSTIRMHDLRDGVLILPKPGSDQRKFIEQAFARQGLSLSPLLTMSDGEVIKQLAIKGVGATIVPATSVQYELAHGELLRLPVPNLEIRFNLSIVWRDEKQFSPAAHAFRDILRREVRREESIR